MIYTKSQTTVIGLDELMKAFKALPDESLEYIKDASMVAGNKVLSKAKQLVPIDTGVTQAKLYLKKPTKSKKVKYQIFSTIAAKKGAAAIAPLELGHNLVFYGKNTGIHIEARPFLRPAADENKDFVINTIADAMSKAVENMGGKK